MGRPVGAAGIPDLSQVGKPDGNQMLAMIFGQLTMILNNLCTVGMLNYNENRVKNAMNLLNDKNYAKDTETMFAAKKIVNSWVGNVPNLVENEQEQ